MKKMLQKSILMLTVLAVTITMPVKSEETVRVIEKNDEIKALQEKVDTLLKEKAEKKEVKEQRQRDFKISLDAFACGGLVAVALYVGGLILKSELENFVESQVRYSVNYDWSVRDSIRELIRESKSWFRWNR